jgi:4-hydroxybenzoate polyprenyltransferase
MDIDLFAWWALSISFSSIFLAIVSIYLFVDTKSRREEGVRKKTNVFGILRNFVFVWVLLGLLVFYIFSINLGAGVLSEAVFTGGNIVVEVLLVLYLLRNREKKSEKT